MLQRNEKKKKNLIKISQCEVLYPSPHSRNDILKEKGALGFLLLQS